MPHPFFVSIPARRADMPCCPMAAAVVAFAVLAHLPAVLVLRAIRFVCTALPNDRDRGASANASRPPRILRLLLLNYCQAKSVRA